MFKSEIVIKRPESTVADKIGTLRISHRESKKMNAVN